LMRCPSRICAPIFVKMVFRTSRERDASESYSDVLLRHQTTSIDFISPVFT
jgi:hypothetical protein